MYSMRLETLLQSKLMFVAVLVLLLYDKNTNHVFD